MKQRELVKKLENAGFIFERHGSNHDIYAKGDEKEEIPRHKEIDKSNYQEKKPLIYCR